MVWSRGSGYSPNQDATVREVTAAQSGADVGIPPAGYPPLLREGTYFTSCPPRPVQISRCINPGFLARTTLSLICNKLKCMDYVGLLSFFYCFDVQTASMPIFIFKVVVDQRLRKPSTCAEKAVLRHVCNKLYL